MITGGFCKAWVKSTPFVDPADSLCRDRHNSRRLAYGLMDERSSMKKIMGAPWPC